jgi:hypothetical protein
MAKSRQIRTISVATTTIMRDIDFERGFEDARNGIPFDWRIGSWGYERGRLLAHIAPLAMQLRIGSKLNPKAIALCEAAFQRKLII